MLWLREAVIEIYKMSIDVEMQTHPEYVTPLDYGIGIPTNLVVKINLASDLTIKPM